MNLSFHRRLITLMIIFFGIFHFAQGQGIVAGYIEKYHQLAISMMKQTGIPASLILSIAVVESAAGTSRNARKINNHFGIKGTKRYKIPGTKSVTAYQPYPSDTLSYTAFCEWVCRKEFYSELRNNNNTALWIKSLGRSGYARANRSWKKHLLLLIDKYCLTEFDCYL